MGLEKFREMTIRDPRRKELLASVLKTIQEHQEQGIERVTSRQLYYQLVAANAVPNSEKSYKMITSLLTDARYWGVIDWDFIVDLGREPIIPQQFKDVEDLMRAAVNSLKYDRWEGQGAYVEVWVEKQALQSVLEPIGRDLHVPIVVNKGYSSASAMHSAAERLIDAEDRGKIAQIVYLGDFDPSGEDMVRDIEDRLLEFGVQDLELEKVGLTLAQIKKFKCPPNPAKTTDSRFDAFAEATGQTGGDVHSWELDSLPVKVLDDLVRTCVVARISDIEKMKAVKRREEKDRKDLQIAAREIAKKRRR